MDNEGIAFAFGAVLGFVLSTFIVALPVDKSWESACVREGVAEYDAKTAKWHWTEKLPIAQKAPVER